MAGVAPRQDLGTLVRMVATCREGHTWAMVAHAALVERRRPSPAADLFAVRHQCSSAAWCPLRSR